MMEIKNFTHRLGNQMFQLATAISLVENKDIVYDSKVAFPKWDYADMFNGDFTPVAFRPQGGRVRVHTEVGFHYTEIPENMNSINGYFQSEKYFIEHEAKIRRMFKIKQEIKDSIYEKHKDLLDRDNVVAVHLRRGDYLNHPDHHPVMGMNYFMKATKKFPKDSIFLVFSDDTKWCNENFPAIGEKFFVIEGQTDREDFAMMTMCDHNVIANSSYSWWSAWLNDNPNKTVVAPKNWFGSAYANHDLKDLYCENWIVI